jgi:hypothetical protein
MKFTIEPTAKLKIIALDPKREERVIAQFNPKEVQVDKAMQWQDHKSSDGTSGLEYTGGGTRTISLELFFDGAEEARSVRPDLDALHSLTEHFGTAHGQKRPPVVMVIWGSSVDDSIPSFPAVIESLGVKYTMFSDDGKVVRATATVKLKEAGTMYRNSHDKTGKRYAA